MLFLTNRAIRESVRTRRNRRIRFDLRDNNACQSLYYAERRGEGDYIEIGNETFQQRLKDSPAEQLLLFLHGFNNLPEEDIFPMTERLQALFDRHNPGMVEVVPLIWPGDDQSQMLSRYQNAQRAADASAFAFARALGFFDDWRMSLAQRGEQCQKRINILAHSMGNRVLRGAVSEWVRHDYHGQVPLLFRNLFMIAADVHYDSLEGGKPAGFLPGLCRNLVVYHAADDLALRGSKTINSGNRITSLRLGHKGPRDMSAVPRNVQSVDCGLVNQAYNPGHGHTYFLENPGGGPGHVFSHIATAVDRGRVAEDPLNLGRWSWDDRDHEWRIESA